MAFSTFLFAVLLLISRTSGEWGCEWGDNNFTIGQQYFEDTCQPGFQLRPDGTCSIQYLDDARKQCNSFCQVRTTFTYGPEQPFLARGYFIGPGVAPSDDKTYPQAVRGSEAIVGDSQKTDILNPGVTNDFEGIAYGVAVDDFNHTQNLTAGFCGYYTFLPITRTVCGTRTYGNDCGNSATTTGNYCGSELQLSGAQDEWMTGLRLHGETAWVWTDCETHLPWTSSQDSAYNGSALNETQYQPYADFWKLFQPGIKPASIDPSFTNCTDGTARETAQKRDCTKAIGKIVALADHKVSISANATTTPLKIMESGTCAVQVRYDEDWTGQSCNVSYVEVAAAAHMIMNSCIPPSGYVIGGQKLRGSNDCASSVLISNLES
ncbi:hypothetical protein H2200_013146 [Cladophialophora chaetospira]|uniref:Uncharacterized protein n=1 Tax=Cladophialophora chaetospira TaxID=386627 RepID=A0AA38WW88_9EURO|nr:hypothetical protein H2200_013146 [Cladophialophora chaetospira]